MRGLIPDLEPKLPAENAGTCVAMRVACIGFPACFLLQPTFASNSS
jgi:hypothetical protein